MTETLLAATEAYVKAQLAEAEAGHDWWHIHRVHTLACKLGETERADMLVVQLSALLHDIADAKFHGGDEELGPARAAAYLAQTALDAERQKHVVDIIRHLSFKGGFNEGRFYSLEYAVVRDADRLDAMGAIGIARTFHYGGFRNRTLYDPAIPPVQYADREAYKSSTAPTLNHFHEKLLLLKEGMLTESGKRLAEGRHAVLQAYVDQFLAEWHGEA
ncbi:MAG: phosphohydrolase [Sphingobacteriaceae bacterium]|nr:phosphohydrolase [Sphingobacteriaceae bacterium]